MTKVLEGRLTRRGLAMLWHLVEIGTTGIVPKTLAEQIRDEIERRRTDGNPARYLVMNPMAFAELAVSIRADEANWISYLGTVETVRHFVGVEVKVIYDLPPGVGWVLLP